MKKTVTILAVLLGLAVSGPSYAQGTNISVEASVDALSGYIWRGGVLGADDKAVVQPRLTFGFGDSGFSLNIWGSFFVQSRTATEGADELDFTADYSGTVSEESGVGFSIGYIQYTFPNGGSGAEHSEEVYGGLSLDHALSPSITIYYDFGLIDDYYVAAGVGPEFPLGDADNAPVLGISASVGIGGDSYGGSAGFQDVTLGASVGFATDSVSISPYIGVAFARDGVKTDDSVFWLGVSFGFSN